MSEPGKYYRKGISRREVFQMFPDDMTAEKWFIKQRWDDNVTCPKCGYDNINLTAMHKTMPFRCRASKCQKRFSVKYGTVMENSNLGYQIWAIAIYLLVTGIKGVSSMKLHHDLGITQKSAWHLAHRLCKCLEADGVKEFVGHTEVDETYIGGKERNKHESKNLHSGHGAVGKNAVIGVRDRDSNEVSTEVIEHIDAPTLHEFVIRKATPAASIFTDDARAFTGLPFKHNSVEHSVGKYVNGMAHTNGIESFWAMLKRCYHGTFHHMSPSHVFRDINDFATPPNIRNQDTLDQIGWIAELMDGERLRYKDLIVES